VGENRTLKTGNLIKALRRQIFNECLSKVPQGPQSVHEKGDWEGVVEECGQQAYYMSLYDANKLKEK
jgi:hypothetical protein